MGFGFHSFVLLYKVSFSGEKQPKIAFFSIFRVVELYRSLGVVRNTRHPILVAVLYFSMSFRKPVEEVCRPPVHTPPSTSRAILCSGIAKSNRHFRTGWNLYSLTHSTRRSLLHIAVNISFLGCFRGFCAIFFGLSGVCLSVVISFEFGADLQQDDKTGITPRIVLH